MRRKIKVGFFLITLILITGLLHFLLVPSSYLRVVLHEVQDQSINYDTIFVGQSLGETNIDPFTVEKKTGENTYNLCRRIISLPDLVYLVKESNYKNDVDVLVIDIDHTYWYTTGIETDYYNDAYIYPHLNNPQNRFDYFLENCLKHDYRIMLSRFVLHGSDDIKNSIERVNQKTSEAYRNYSMDAVSESGDHFEYVGRGFRYGVKREENYHTGVEWDESRIDPKALESFENIVDYCRKNDIKLICIKAPMPQERLSEKELFDMNEYFTKLTSNFGVDYIDFNFVKKEYLQWQADDFQDGEGHMMGPFAEKYSEVLGIVLNDYLLGKNIQIYFSKNSNSVE